MRGPAPGFCALLLAAVLPGCGTLFGRTRADYIGAYPGQAIVFDVWAMSSLFQGKDPERPHDDLERRREGEMNFVGGLLSLPFDVVIDVVLLPADLIGWLFGLEKDFSRC